MGRLRFNLVTLQEAGRVSSCHTPISTASEKRVGGVMGAKQRFAVLSVMIVLFAVSAPIARAQSTGQSGTDEGSRLFPAGTHFYLRINDVGDVVQRALDHPLRDRIAALDQVKEGLTSPQFVQARLALGLFESQIDTDWLTALKALGGRGIHVGGDLAAQSFGLAVHSSDEELLKKSAGVILGFVKGQAKGDTPPYTVSDYRGGKLAQFEERLTVGRFGAWLLISNKHVYLTGMADRLLDRSTDNSLASSPTFQSAHALAAEDADAWLWTDLEPIRASGQAQDLFRGMTDEPAVELLFGGILEALRDAPWVAADLSIRDDGVALNAQLPYDASLAPAEREFFFGTGGRGRAPAELDIPDVMAQVTTYRDLGNWWLSKEDLFPENVVAGLAQGDSQLSTVFGGVDFGSEVLGSLQPGMRLIVKRQTYPEGTDPDTKLPAFALVTRLQNPEQARRFRISFQSLVGLLNLVDDGMDRPLIDVMSTREEGIELTAGTYAPEGGFDGSLLIFNFSPALAFQDDYMIVSSTEELAREVALKTRELDAGGESSASNTTMSVSIPELTDILRRNREALVANQMLDRGLDRADAEKQLDLVFDLLDYGRDARIDFRVEPEAMHLSIELNLTNRKGE